MFTVWGREDEAEEMPTSELWSRFDVAVGKSLMDKCTAENRVDLPGNKLFVHRRAAIAIGTAIEAMAELLGVPVRTLIKQLRKSAHQVGSDLIMLFRVDGAGYCDCPVIIPEGFWEIIKLDSVQ